MNFHIHQNNDVNILTRLFNEKKYKEKEINKPIKYEIKDNKEETTEDELKYYEFNEINGIKIYNGVLIGHRPELEKRIKFFKSLSTREVFSKVIPSTLTAIGELTNIQFNEVDYITKFNIPPTEFNTIIHIGCNYGEVHNYPNQYYTLNIPNLLKVISLLKGENIKIQCLCQTEPIDTKKIYEFLSIYNANFKKFKKLSKTVKDVIKNHTKKRVNKIMKNLKYFREFLLYNKKEIEELYCVFEMALTEKKLEFCLDFMNNIIDIIKQFTHYFRKCKCTNLNFEQIVTKTRPAKKKISKRKKQGTGMYFSSQITFDIYNVINSKKSKIKLFRNGNISIPGVKNPNMTDIIDVVETLRNYLNYVEKRNDVQIPYLLSVMRNYTCRLNNQDLRILLPRLEEVLYHEKNIEIVKPEQFSYLNSIFDKNVMECIFSYYNKGFFNISEIDNKCERSPGLHIKFIRPIPGKENKRLTIKILSSGKINFDGANSELDVYESYYWLQYLFNKYWDEIIYDTNFVNYIEVSSDSEDYLSLYDSD